MGVKILTESNADLGRNNLSILVNYMSMGCGLIALLHFITGGLLYSDENAQIVYGSELLTLGGYMVLLGFVAIIYGFGGVYAAKSHNRLVIVVCMCLQTISIAGEIAISETVRSIIQPEFEEDVAKDCLSQAASELYEDSLCVDYFNSNRTSALWGLWQHWLVKASEEPALASSSSGLSYQRLLLQIQSGYACCGFSRPQMCRVNRTLTASSTDLYASGVRAPGLCGAYETAFGTFQSVERWYPATDDCDITVFQGATITYQGGCPFDLPYGEACVSRSDYESDPYVSGCALGVEDYVNSDLYAVSDTMMFLVALQTVFTVTLLCFFFKRKVHDVTPPQGWQKMSDGFED